MQGYALHDRVLIGRLVVRDYNDWVRLRPRVEGELFGAAVAPEGFLAAACLISCSAGPPAPGVRVFGEAVTAWQVPR